MGFRNGFFRNRAYIQTNSMIEDSSGGKPTENGGCATGDDNPMPEIMDKGNDAQIFNISRLARDNRYYRIVAWTGEHMQLALMSIPQGKETGPEVHEGEDQFIRVERGVGEVYMGRAEGRITTRAIIDDNYAVIVPAGVWHNIKNIGKGELKLSTIYAPPHHPYGDIEEKIP